MYRGKAKLNSSFPLIYMQISESEAFSPAFSLFSSSSYTCIDVAQQCTVSCPQELGKGTTIHATLEVPGNDAGAGSWHDSRDRQEIRRAKAEPNWRLWLERSRKHCPLTYCIGKATIRSLQSYSPDVLGKHGECALFIW